MSAAESILARKREHVLAMAASVPFNEPLCGYVGVNDGWTDLADNYLSRLAIRGGA